MNLYIISVHLPTFSPQPNRKICSTIVSVLANFFILFVSFKWDFEGQKMLPLEHFQLIQSHIRHGFQNFILLVFHIFLLSQTDPDSWENYSFLFVFSHFISITQMGFLSFSSMPIWRIKNAAPRKSPVGKFAGSTGGVSLFPLSVLLLHVPEIFCHDLCF